MYGVNPPLFPEFVWHEYFWMTSATLPAWQGLQVRNGPYGAVSSQKPSDGLVHIVFAPEGRDDSALTPDDINAVRWVIDHEKSIHAAMLQILVATKSPSWFPKSIARMILKNKVGVVSINVHPLHKDGIPFIGVELGCTWDEEHGAGVLLHGDRALEYGQADTAILLWVAQQYL